MEGVVDLAVGNTTAGVVKELLSLVRSKHDLFSELCQVLKGECFSNIIVFLVISDGDLNQPAYYKKFIDFQQCIHAIGKIKLLICQSQADVAAHIHSTLLIEKSKKNDISLLDPNIDKRILTFLYEVPHLGIPGVSSLLSYFKGKTLKDIICSSPKEINLALPWYNEQKCRNIAHYFSRSFEADKMT